MERKFSREHSICLLLVFTCLSSRAVHALTLVVEGKECLSQHIEAGDTVTGSFVVLDIDSAWRDDLAAIDFWITSPHGNKQYEVKEQSEGTFQFMADWSGQHQFCMENQEHLAETVEFNFNVGHVHKREELATDEHMAEMMHQVDVINLEIGTIQQDQAYFRGREMRRRRTNESTNKRVLYYALLETVVLIGASALQVYVLKHMFERRGYGRG
eukprot:jgi/Mesen1/4736/ME000241S03768